MAQTSVVDVDKVKNKLLGSGESSRKYFYNQQDSSVVGYKNIICLILLVGEHSKALIS